jgi:hypothetical protein
MSKTTIKNMNTISAYFIYMFRVMWYVFLILATIFFAQYDSDRFIYWDSYGGDKSQKPVSSVK